MDTEGRVSRPILSRHRTTHIGPIHDRYPADDEPQRPLDPRYVREHEVQGKADRAD